MRWLIGCVCCLLLPSVASAKCSLRSFPFLHCPGKDTTTSAFAPWEEPDYFSPSDQPARVRWSMKREEPQKLHLPELHLGKGPRISYHRHEVTLTRDCWHLTFRAFSKIALACHSTF